MSSQLQISIKLSTMICLIDIFLLWKFQVIWIIQTELFIRGLIFRIFENSNRVLRQTPQLGIELSLFRLELLSVPDILLSLEYSEEFFYFVLSFWWHFLQISLYFLYSIPASKMSRFRVLNKAVLGGRFDQLKERVLVAPQKCPLAEALPVCQNEIV